MLDKKGISGVVSIIILLLITISLAATAYTVEIYIKEFLSKSDLMNLQEDKLNKEGWVKICINNTYKEYKQYDTYWREACNNRTCEDAGFDFLNEFQERNYTIKIRWYRDDGLFQPLQELGKEKKENCHLCLFKTEHSIFEKECVQEVWVNVFYPNI